MFNPPGADLCSHSLSMVCNPGFPDLSVIKKKKFSFKINMPLFPYKSVFVCLFFKLNIPAGTQEVANQ